MIGTEFESLPYAEPGWAGQGRARRSKRVLILGAGVSGIECARVAAGRGHDVEVWEKASKVGGQMDLAVAAPDKAEAGLVWTYRWREIQELGVTVRMDVTVTPEQIRGHRPDVVVIATGATPKPAPFGLLKLAPRVEVHDAWAFLRTPDLVPRGARTTVVGGGTVGMETADLLAARGCAVTLIELSPAIAAGMSRSNRREVLDRLARAGVTTLLNTRIIEASGDTLRISTAGSDVQTHEIGDFLLLALGAQSNQSAMDVVVKSGAPFVTVGDCHRPGDFMTCIRDAWMVGLSIDHYPIDHH